jgi:prolyl-tRNA editing enzyme YbaK/EbsC (Cys-tRNA(Pro) deacylase)
MAATPAIALAEREGIRFVLHDYEHDPNAGSYRLGAASALGHRPILVNAGRRGLQLELDPHDLVRLTGARVHEIASGR